MVADAEVVDLLRSRFSSIHVELSPPRTASTALSRVIWGSPGIAFHAHEPFESRYWGSACWAESMQNLREPMRVTDGIRTSRDDPQGGLLVKDMTFQVDRPSFGLLAELTTAPILFAFLDPRLALHSRLRKVVELGRGDTFPPFESGWSSFEWQTGACDELGIEYSIVDTSDLRADPLAMTEKIFDAVGLARAESLSWEPRPELALCRPEVGALMSDARRSGDPFFRRVLSSSGIEPVDEVDMGEIEHDLTRAGLEEHLVECMGIYRRALASPHRIRAGSGSRS